MTDARFPERWLLDRRINRLSDRDFRSFVYSLVWSAGNKTDGLIERQDWALIPHFSPDSAGALVAAELWEVVTHHREIAWRIADFKNTQSSRDELDALEGARRSARDKKRRQRARKAAVSLGQSTGHVPKTVPPTTQARPGQDRTGTSEPPKGAKKTNGTTPEFAPWEPQ